jgi:hypothetical protein
MFVGMDKTIHKGEPGPARAAGACQGSLGLARACQGSPGPARARQGLPGLAWACQGWPGLARACQGLPGPAREKHSSLLSDFDGNAARAGQQLHGPGLNVIKVFSSATEAVIN